MNIKIKALIIPSILAFLLLAIKFPFKIAGGILLIILAGISLKLFIKKAKREYLILNGIKSVPKELVFNNNTLTNNHCIVRYFQNKKIIVMDNPTSKERTTLRAFVVDMTNHENVPACWNAICSVYDEYTYLDTLLSFIDKSSGRLNIMFLNREESKFAVEGMEEFLPKPEIKTPPLSKVQNKKLVQKTEENTQKGQIIVDFNELQQQNIKTPVKNNDSQNVVNMQDLSDSDKIDVNLANAQTISELPGINIVIAKKIVEYRNLNGFFKNKEDFINISEVKEHFKAKILSMITVEKSSAVVLSKELEAEKERTVD